MSRNLKQSKPSTDANAACLPTFQSSRYAPKHACPSTWASTIQWEHQNWGIFRSMQYQNQKMHSRNQKMQNKEKLESSWHPILAVVPYQVNTSRKGSPGLMLPNITKDSSSRPLPTKSKSWCNCDCVGSPSVFHTSMICLVERKKEKKKCHSKFYMLHRDHDALLAISRDVDTHP